MKKKTLFQLISLILCCCLLLQTMVAGVVAAARLTVTVLSDTDDVVQSYSNAMDMLAGTHSFSNGRAGTLTFDDFTLKPRLQMDALSIASNIYPVSISLTYGAPEFRFLTDECSETIASLGGFRTNYHSFVKEIVYTDLSRLYWFTGSGQCRVFEKTVENGVTTWTVDGGDTVITEIITNNETTYEADLGDGQIYTFDTLGRLIAEENETANISLEITYQSGANAPFDAISQIKDGIGNTFRFTYTNNKVTKIKAYTPAGVPIVAGDGDNAAPLEINFTYTNDLLTEMTFPDGEAVSFSYAADGSLTGTENIDKNRLQLTYLSGTLRTVTKQVYDETNETYLTDESLTITKLAPLATKFEDGYNHWQRMDFTADGVLISIVDENGQYLYGEPEPEPDPDPDPEPDPEEPETNIDPPASATVSTCICSGCEEYNCPCTCEDEEDCTCPQCQRRTYTETDVYGNVTAEKEFDGTKTRQETNTYTANGAYLAGSTDTAGNQISYAYSNAGFITSVSSGASVGSMKYDAMGNLTEFSQNVTGLSSGQQMKNEYEYENDRVSAITHNGFTYDFSYDVWEIKNR